MSIMNLFKRQKSAPQARERLQVLLAHERSSIGQSDLVTILREEILAVISKHVQLDADKVQVKLDRDRTMSGTLSRSPRNPVSTGPGHTHPTWMLRDSRSMPAARENARRPAFDAEYVASPGSGTMPAMLATCTIEPPCSR